MKEAHISIDDCTKCFRNLYENNNDSIYQNTFFRTIKMLNKRYSFKVTLYCWSIKSGFEISQLNDRYRKEFEENSDWLKFGFHSSEKFNYLEDKHLGRKEKEFYKEVSDFNDCIIHIAGKNSISSRLRLHYYTATDNEIQFLNEIGVKELLTSHDGRISYNLTKEQQELVDFNGSIKIEEQNYIKSDLCIDGIKNKDEIMKYIGRNRITFFSHEEFFLRDILKWEEIIKLLKDNQFEFIV